MFVLFETPSGHALFSLDGKTEKSLKKGQLGADAFATSRDAAKALQLVGFGKFADTGDAMATATSIAEGKVSDGMRKFLQKELLDEKKRAAEKVLIDDLKLVSSIKAELPGVAAVAGDEYKALFRGIRAHLSTLLGGIDENQLTAMKMGLAHSLSRFAIKFSPDKVDTMIIQAISLLDETQKQLNTYAMRVREWYGFHFPEMAKVVNDNIAYAKLVLKIGQRVNLVSAESLDLSDILSEEVEKELKEEAHVSVGHEISEDDLDYCQRLCKQVLGIYEQRQQLEEYLNNRMRAIAPNLTVVLGELLGARLIAKAGSLMNLAKAPASTIQIMGAEKALFAALKARTREVKTPKYGLIYHASLVGQAPPQFKGRMSRSTAAGAALAARVDALGEATEATIGFERRAKLDDRLHFLKTGEQRKSSGSGRGAEQQTKVDTKARTTYNAAADSTLISLKKDKKESDKMQDEEQEERVEAGSKRAKPSADEDEDESDNEAEAEVEEPAKKKQKKKDKSKKKKDKKEKKDKSAKKKEKKEKKEKKDKSKKKKDKSSKKKSKKSE
ncbi:MAG: hypothetical protein MHM6MM_004821 [Cercozoa sp. M6MM]